MAPSLFAFATPSRRSNLRLGRIVANLPGLLVKLHYLALMEALYRHRDQHLCATSGLDIQLRLVPRPFKGVRMPMRYRKAASEGAV